MTSDEPRFIEKWKDLIRNTLLSEYKPLNEVKEKDCLNESSSEAVKFKISTEAAIIIRHEMMNSPNSARALREAEEKDTSTFW